MRCLIDFNSLYRHGHQEQTDGNTHLRNEEAGAGEAEVTVTALRVI